MGRVPLLFAGLSMLKSTAVLALKTQRPAQVWMYRRPVLNGPPHLRDVPHRWEHTGNQHHFQCADICFSSVAHFECTMYGTCMRMYGACAHAVCRVFGTEPDAGFRTAVGKPNSHGLACLASGGRGPRGNGSQWEPGRPARGSRLQAKKSKK